MEWDDKKQDLVEDKKESKAKFNGHNASATQGHKEEVDVEETKKNILKRWNSLSQKQRNIIIVCLIIFCSLMIWYGGLRFGVKLVTKDMLQHCICY